MAGDHISYMSEVLASLLSSWNSKVISEAKYDKIVAHLSQPHAATDTADPKLRWWSEILCHIYIIRLPVTVAHTS